MHFTHESRYLHAQLSRAAVIVQPGHFNWPAVLVPVYKPRNGFTISTDSCPTSLHRGREAACLLSACYYWMISRVDVSSLLTRKTNSQIKQRKTGCTSSCSAPTRLLTDPETRRVSLSRLSNAVYFRLVLFPFASAVYAFIMLDFRVWKCGAAQKPTLG